jgi:hypothetical protein
LNDSDDHARLERSREPRLKKENIAFDFICRRKCEEDVE